MGWHFLHDFDGRRVVGHDGNLPAFAFPLLVSPDGQIGVVVLTNTATLFGAPSARRGEPSLGAWSAAGGLPAAAPLMCLRPGYLKARAFSRTSPRAGCDGAPGSILWRDDPRSF
jgi:hypothetical protein